uniref:Succinate:cytochrome c oxidoreductase subunit 4 n=1 Tax=Chroomonas placoidea TaxID=173977 RepID=A0A2P1G7Z7_9CRYP|nr:succinate:cytochrome c oxidoreductase subunit 4 [Chroomonas placoidea]AVM81084.1 succinate:cytochrome c oxidoreductase subunit 4 [Chroomonas placoidea]
MKFYSVGFSHWISQRMSAVLLISLSFSLFYFESLYVSNFILILVIFHFKLGFETLFEDYVHDIYLKTFGAILLRLIGIYALKFLFLSIIL